MQNFWRSYHILFWLSNQETKCLREKKTQKQNEVVQKGIIFVLSYVRFAAKCMRTNEQSSYHLFRTPLKPKEKGVSIYNYHVL